MTDRELMQWALAALDGYARNCRCEGGGAPCDAAQALRARLAKPDEPNWAAAGFSKLPKQQDRQCPSCGGFCKKSGCERENVPPKREFIGLTDEEIEKLVYDIRSQTTGVVATAYVARAIEQALKEKNHAV